MAELPSSTGALTTACQKDTVVEFLWSGAAGREKNKNITSPKTPATSALPQNKL